MKKKIYLAGNISYNPETYKWRERATKFLENEYEVMNPAANRFNKDLLKEEKGAKDSTEFLKKAIDRSQGILIIKDFQLVNSADIILVNLQIITSDKPMIGTMFELAWAWYLNKPIIAIVGDTLYSKHPFIARAISGTADTLEEACALIKEFFRE